MKLKLHIAILLTSLSLALSVKAGYQPLTAPAKWKFAVSTAAYHPDTGETLGDFQPGLEVAVLKEDIPGGVWLVEYRPYGAQPVRALIAIPDLSKAKPKAYDYVQEDIEQFPLLKKQLEADNTWPTNILMLSDRIFREPPTLEDGTEAAPRKLVSSTPMSDGIAWGLMPLQVTVDATRGDTPRIIIEYWNKGDRNSAIDPRKGHPMLIEHLGKIENAFDTGQGMRARSAGGSGITALGNDTENYFLPNDIRASVRYRNGEYLILELTSFRGQKPLDPADFTAEKMMAVLRENVATSQDGDRYVAGVPMISQGDKGYCVAATIARVLSYYGYPVDMHAVAKLAETEAYGTSYENVISAMRRVCGSTPFRMKELRNTDKASIQSVIDQGLPIIWLVPGHVRLLIGVNMKENSVVYSDSWGPEHAFKTMSYDEFLNYNYAMYILEPQS